MCPKPLCLSGITVFKVFLDGKKMPTGFNKHIQTYMHTPTQSYSGYFSELWQPQASWKQHKRKVILNNATNGPDLVCTPAIMTLTWPGRVQSQGTHTQRILSVMLEMHSVR